MQETSWHTEHYTRAAVSIGRRPHCTAEFEFPAICMHCLLRREIRCISDLEFKRCPDIATVSYLA